VTELEHRKGKLSELMLSELRHMHMSCWFCPIYTT